MIEIKNLFFSYDSIDLFKDLNIQLKEGKIYGLIGKNGAGKTSFLKIICGLLYSKSGICKVLNYDSHKRIPAMLKEIYFILETYFLPETSIETYEKLISPFYDRFDKTFFYEKIIELELNKNLLLNNLSFGQKKKFLFIFGLSTKCKLFILDEPTNGLDIPSQIQIRKLIVECMLDNRSIIISTHHVKEMENIFDSLIIIDKGKIIFNNDIETINNKLSINIVHNLDELPDILYSEEIPGGYSIITKNTSSKENKIDIEFLFNAIINQNEKINNIFNN